MNDYLYRAAWVMVIAPWLAGIAAPLEPTVSPADFSLPAEVGGVAPRPPALAETLPSAGDGRFDQPDPEAAEPITPTVEPELLLPDLQTMPPSGLRLETDARPGRTRLRLALTFWNNGQGPLELAGTFDASNRRTLVWQQLYAEDGSIHPHLAGEFVWHAGHDHWHFENFAIYEVWSLSGDGDLDRVVASSGKVTFCILETDIIDRHLPGFSRWRKYDVCGPDLQGLSVGWGDTYKAHLVGQTVDITDVADGIYALRVTVDPDHRLQESDDANNAAVTYMEIVNHRLYVFEGLEQVRETLTGCPVRC